MTNNQQGEKQKLSDLLLKGCTIRPQQAYLDYSDGKEDGGTCALGAIYEALTGNRPLSYEEAPGRGQEIPYTIQQATGVGEDTLHYNGEYKINIYYEIIERNDHRHETREEIATWLQSIGY